MEERQDPNSVFSKNMQSQFGEFVRVKDVRQIVEDVTMPILHAMELREAEAIKAANQINQLTDEVKRMQSDTRQVQLIRGNVNSL